MGRVFCLLVLSALGTSANAQRILAGFGNAHVGVAMNVCPDLEKDLGASSFLGPDLHLNRPSVLGGAEGYLTLRRMMFGGSVFVITAEDETTRGRAELTIGSACIHLGYLSTIRNQLIAFPYIGAGGLQTHLNLTNSSANAMMLGIRTLERGQQVKLVSHGLCFEAGYSVQFLLFSLLDSDKHYGFMLGLQAGAYMFVAAEKWHVDASDESVPSFTRPISFSPYIRMTIGGGGFYMGEN